MGRPRPGAAMPDLAGRFSRRAEPRPSSSNRRGSARFRRKGHDGCSDLSERAANFFLTVHLRMPDPPPGIPQFPATRWSVVVTASSGGAAARAALEELCRLYWFPLYAFARQSGCSPEDAEDETQEFLARVASRELLAVATATRGRLRTFLLAAFQRDLIDAHRRATRQKRGGGAEVLSIDALNAEGRLSALATTTSAESTYDRLWAMTCLEAAMAALETEYARRDRQALFQTLRPFLDPASEGDYATAAAASGLDPNAVRQAVFRLRQRFRALLRLTIGDTLESPTEALIEEELAALRAALSA